MKKMFECVAKIISSEYEKTDYEKIPDDRIKMYACYSKSIVKEFINSTSPKDKTSDELYKLLKQKTIQKMKETK